MEAKNNNSEGFSLLKLAQQAALQKRLKTAGLLYKLAMLSKPHLSSSISSLLKNNSKLDEIVNTSFPNLCIILDIKYGDTIKALLQQSKRFSIVIAKIVLFVETRTNEAENLIDDLRSNNIIVEVTDKSSSSPIAYWLQQSVREANHDVLPVFVEKELPGNQLSKDDFLQLLAQSLFYPGGQNYALQNENKRNFDLSTATNVGLVLTVTSFEISDDALRKISLFSKVTGTKVHLLASSAEFIFGSENIMSWLEEETVDRIQVSDSNLHFRSDVTEFIKKLNTDRAVVTPIELSIYALPLLYKMAFHHFEIPDFISDWFEVVSVKDIQNSGKARLKDLLLTSETALLGQKKVAGFITEQAIERLGGAQKFSKLPFAYNGVLFSEINEWWMPSTPSFGKATGFNYFPLEVESRGKTSLIFDIQPITKEAHPAFRYVPEDIVNLRRRIITARRLPTKEPKVTFDNALFVMTCFNKEQFVEESIFGVLMQTYSHVELNFCDDASTDKSVDIAKNILSFVEPAFLKNIYEGKGGEGTYQLRNKVIHQSLNGSTVYFINDADDISCARRADLQLSQLASPEKLYTFGDITRVDSHGHSLTLEGVSERYGTASFAAKANLHQVYGFYENLNKGADTEFIERMQYFAPSDSGLWWRYPVLFQSYANDNLTSDIYAITEEGNLVQDISARTKYLELFRERHKRMLKSSLSNIFAYNNVHFPLSYHQGIPEFFTSTPKTQILPDVSPLVILTGMNLDTLGWNDLPAKISIGNKPSSLKIVSDLATDKHDYLLVNKTGEHELFEALKKDETGLFFKATGDLGICFVIIYLNEHEEKLSHQFFWVNQAMPVKMPTECRVVQLGFRVQGQGTCHFEMIEIGNF